MDFKIELTLGFKLSKTIAETDVDVVVVPDYITLARYSRHKTVETVGWEYSGAQPWTGVTGCRG